MMTIFRLQLSRVLATALGSFTGNYPELLKRVLVRRRVFITGTAGFISFHLSRLLLSEGFVVTGYDGMTDYYDVRLKRDRHRYLFENPRIYLNGNVFGTFSVMEAALRLKAQHLLMASTSSIYGARNLNVVFFRHFEGSDRFRGMGNNSSRDWAAPIKIVA